MNTLKNKLRALVALTMALSLCVGCGDAEKAETPQCGTPDNALNELGIECEPAEDGIGSPELNGDIGIAEDAEGKDAASVEVFAIGDVVLGDKSNGLIGDTGSVGEVPDISSDTTILPVEDNETDDLVNLLTAGVWNDLDNWGFFSNLVNTDLIQFPAYGLDPCKPLKVVVQTNDSNNLENLSVRLVDADNKEIWSAMTNSQGVAYIFGYDANKEASIIIEDSTGKALATEKIEEKDNVLGDSQGNNKIGAMGEIEIPLELENINTRENETQVMFIMDTTGSMGDELTYLQLDFADIVKEVGTDNISYSVNFYRDKDDEYVTRCNNFSTNVDEISTYLNNETADGGGDIPEAVAEVLQETIINNQEWKREANKIAFLIFDAPPHAETSEQVIEAVKTAASKGIHIIPVVSSNSERSTELFGRALAILTNSDYVFLTDDSGIGGSHLEPIIGDYEVKTLHDTIIELITKYRG